MPSRKETPRRESLEFVDTYGALKRCLTALANEVYADEGLPAAQVRLLRHVGRNPTISQAELARATGSDPALTGRTVEALIERGWLKRTRSQEDKRQYLLEVGAPGRKILVKVDDVRVRVSKRIAAVLDQRDFEDFERVAKKLLAALGASPNVG